MRMLLTMSPISLPAEEALKFTPHSWRHFYNTAACQLDIKYTIRAGRVWFDRPRATRTIRCEQGASFTLKITPQIVNDLKSVSKYLEVK